MSPRPLKKRFCLKRQKSVRGIHAVHRVHSAAMWIQSNNALSREGLRRKAGVASSSAISHIDSGNQCEPSPVMNQ